MLQLVDRLCDLLVARREVFQRSGQILFVGVEVDHAVAREVEQNGLRHSLLLGFQCLADRRGDGVRRFRSRDDAFGLGEENARCEGFDLRHRLRFDQSVFHQLADDRTRSVVAQTSGVDIHAGGLRYHGAGSIVSQLMKDGLIEAQAMPQVETLAAGVLFAQTEGIIPAPESTHAIAATIREALKAKEEGVSKTILFNLSGNGVIDLYAYEQYLAGALKDFSPSDEEIAKTVNQLEHLI